MEDEKRRKALRQQVEAAKEHLDALRNEQVKIEISAWVGDLIQAIDAYQSALASEAIGSPREAELYTEIMRIHRDAIDERSRFDRLGFV